MDSRWAILDGNEAAASVAYRTNEVIAIYPITPASPMGELADAWAAHGRTNIWGTVPEVSQLQSEGGAAGTVHGSLQAGALTTTFTASQGLLLMIPNLYKIAGELTPFCMHVAARTVATHALSIFGDHSDVMACRQTGFALLASGSVQEALDLAVIAQAATLRSRIPFIHFFDGFRTSHEINTIEQVSDNVLRMMVDGSGVEAHRARALTPDRPVIRGTAQNPDTFFQAREAANPYYEAAPSLIQAEMDRFAELTGRPYRLFDYAGDPEAERVLVIMGSGGETAADTAAWLNEQGERVGVIRVRLYRPFDPAALVRAIPATARTIGVLDRTKEPGAVGEPLYQDVVTAIQEAHPEAGRLTVVGGRYGLSSKEFTPAMVQAVFDHLREDRPRNHFTVGIRDDVSGSSLEVPEDVDIEGDELTRAVFFGLGSDGTVSANKNSIKILGEEVGIHAQAYFVYDSKKAGAMTVSHLRFGPRPIRASYLISRADFVACHQFSFLERHDVLAAARPGATVLINSPHPADRVWAALPRPVQETLIRKRLRLFVVDAYALAGEVGLGRRINTIMQVCFFAISGVIDPERAIEKIKLSIEQTYRNKGRTLVERNLKAVDRARDGLVEVPVPERAEGTVGMLPPVPVEAPDFVQRVTARIIAGEGDLLPVSAFPVDGTWPLGTAKWEKRNIADTIPEWDPSICIQCNKCTLVCPHAAIRAKVYDPAALGGAPPEFRHADFRAPGIALAYSIQVAPEDCTGCTLCYRVCPAKDKANPSHRALEMVAQPPRREAERTSFEFFLGLTGVEPQPARPDLKHIQLRDPLFEFSGACAGCGETPYIKLLTQLFGDRLMIANATGCSSIYGGNLPTTPYTTNRDGRGPAWANSLFEDNAEFGYGFRLAIDSQKALAERLLRELASEIGETLVDAILTADQTADAGIAAQRERVADLRSRLERLGSEPARRLLQVVDYLVTKSVWLVGGDGWAYDIGYGGLDHVLGQGGRNVNVLVLDTEVYSNTGGQASKATPMGAAAKFAILGKATAKKDLGMEMMSYGRVYVAQIAFGAKDTQTQKALQEADSYPGPSLVIAYSHCIAHGYDLAEGLGQQGLAVDSGAWPLYRFDPRRADAGLPPLQIDSRPPHTPIRQYMQNEARFRIAERLDPVRFQRLLGDARRQAQRRYALYEQLAGITLGGSTNGKDTPDSTG